MVEPSTGNTPGTLQPETVSTKLRRIAMRVQQPLRASAAPRVRTAAVGGGIRERICQMKNRMREIRTSGSVRGEGGNPLAYSTHPQRWNETAVAKVAGVTAGRKRVKRIQFPGVEPKRWMWDSPPYAGRTPSGRESRTRC